MDSFRVAELASEASRAPYAEEMNYLPVPWSPFTLDDHLILAYNDMLAVCMFCALQQLQSSLRKPWSQGQSPRKIGQ